MYTEMSGTDPHLFASGVAIGFGILALLGSVVTWYASRAKKVRLVEDQVLEAVRVQRARAEAVETKLAEWQVTIQGMLAEAEEFFERSVRERKRTQQHATRIEQAEQPAAPLENLTRADQIAAIKRQFNS